MTLPDNASLTVTRDGTLTVISVTDGTGDSACLALEPAALLSALCELAGPVTLAQAAFLALAELEKVAPAEASRIVEAIVSHARGWKPQAMGVVL